MRPESVPLHARPRRALGDLRVVASAELRPRGEDYDPVQRLRRRAIALRGGPDAIVVAFSWVAGRVRLRVLAAGAWTSSDVESAIDTARAFAAVDDDPSEFVAMARRHPVLGPLVRRTDVRLGRTPTLFESLTVAIIEQLVTGYEARRSIRRLWQAAGAPVPGTDIVAAPLPAAVRRVPMWKMHAMGIGSRRAATLFEAAGRGDAIERLRAHAPEVAMDKLESLRGVGPWTANEVARRGLGHPDAVPIDDFHAPFQIPAAFGRDDLDRDDRARANEVMLEVLEPFRPHRARVTILLEKPAPGARFRLPRIDPHRREPWRY